MSKDEDWCVDEKHEIHLKNDNCSQLPNSPNCPTLVKLFLQLPRLTVIPLSFFDCMPMLEVLDISNPNIMSLPPSISKLKLLQELFLRDCSALMELPPQIGELKNLRLFDLEGSEIMYLPEEIGNLKDLECFRVSLSTHADHYIKTKVVKKPIIPRMMISKLTKLKELSIDVSPEAEWWEDEVKAIQPELCHLADLETLKWYIPTAKVLQQFLHLERNGVAIYVGLSDFKLTIGHHAQLTSCLPRDLEKKFEKFNKSLRCANDEGSMTDISKIIGTARALLLHRHWTIKRLSDFNICKLKHCLLVECNEMQTLVEAEDVSRDGESDTENGEKSVLGSLQYLGIHSMKKLQSIWSGPFGKNSLSRLRVLALHKCLELTTIFTQNVAENLLNLTELIVEDCSKVKSIVSIECPPYIFAPVFRNLKKIVLLDLPELVSICRGQPISPELDSMLIYNCLKLQYLSSIELLFVKEIKADNEWWNAVDYEKLKWSGIFVELKKGRDLVVELAEATNSLQHFHDTVEISQSPDIKHQTAGNSQNYGTSRQSEAANEAPQGTYSSHHTSSMPTAARNALPREKLFPERPDQPECQYYMRTGDCKYGPFCRYHHPKEITTPVPNTLMSLAGLPLRPGKPLCSYYSKYGLCKFGPSCKFDHPMGGLTLTNNYQPSTLPFRPSIWSYYGSGVRYPLPREKVFPEKPDQPECQYYMKTGDCKFGATCKFHHPKERKFLADKSLLSQLGLPLRPGEPLCTQYSRTGMCTFGPNCEFDHPMVSSRMGMLGPSNSSSSEAHMKGDSVKPSPLQIPGPERKQMPFRSLSFDIDGR